MWLNKPHYYSADNNYYNFPYAFGLLFGLGVYALSQEEGSKFMSKYNDLLKATGKNKIEDVAKMVDIDVTESEFWISSLEVIEKNIKKFKELANKRI
jgi:oligoendopeptidase F